MTEEGIVAEIEIDLTSYRSESVPPNEPQYLDDLEQVKRGECTVNDLRGKGVSAPAMKVRPASESTDCLLFSETEKSSKTWLCMHMKQRLKIALFCLVIATIWGGLLILPIVFFNIRADSEEMDDTGVIRTGGNASGQSSGNSSSDDLDNSTTTSEGSNRMMLRNCSTIQCSDGFHCTLRLVANRSISICSPRCDTWQQYPDSVEAARNALLLVGDIVGLTAGITALIIIAIRWRQVLAFPSVLSFYLTVSLMILATLSLISFVDKPLLYCSSTDLQESVANLTFFCSLSGALLHYLVQQTVYIWIIHVATLFFIVRFPFRARTFREEKKFKYVHIAAVIVILVFPTIPVIAIVVTDGFVIGSFPPQQCPGRNRFVLFYVFLLPIAVLSVVGTTLLLLLFYEINKHYGIFRAKKSRSPIKFSTAEKKILLSFGYYFLMTVTGIVTFTLLTTNSGKFSQGLQNYFACEARGINNDTMPCDRNEYLKHTQPQLLSFTQMLFELFPVLTLIYVIDFGMLMKFCKSIRSEKPDIYVTEATSV